VMRFVAAPDSVQPTFVLSPLLGRPQDLVPSVRVGGVAMSLVSGPKLVRESRVQQVWETSFAQGELRVKLWAHVRSNDPVVDYEWCALTARQSAVRARLLFEFSDDIHCTDP